MEKINFDMEKTVLITEAIILVLILDSYEPSKHEKGIL